MNTKTIFHGLRALGLVLMAGLLVALAPNRAFAAGHFGVGGAGHVGGAFRAGGYHGVYGGYGFRGGWGWRGYGYCCYGWWGWPGYGLFLATLPLYYSTLWWGGVPYYYAYDNYYVWDGTAGGYVAVTPPPEVLNQSAYPPGAAPPPGAAAPPGAALPPWAESPPGGAELFAYPKNAQSDEQQQRDKQECRAWAAAQAGAGGPNRGDNLRAQTACLEARGYSVR